MVKLYKNISGKLFYTEFWINNNIATIHWGVVGNIGKTKTVECNDLVKFEADFIKKYSAQGYKQIPMSQQYLISVQYTVKGDDSEIEKKKNQLIDNFNETLGWRGIGHVDGFDIDFRPTILGKRQINIFLQVVHKDLTIQIVNQIMEAQGIVSFHISSRMGSQ